MDTKYKICAVVVTFNRKELLINCLNAINEQTYKPHTVIIVDNASTDGTKDLVKQNGYCNIMLMVLIINICCFQIIKVEQVAFITESRQPMNLRKSLMLFG